MKIISLLALSLSLFLTGCEKKEKRLDARTMGSLKEGLKEMCEGLTSEEEELFHLGYINMAADVAPTEIPSSDPEVLLAVLKSTLHGKTRSDIIERGRLAKESPENPMLVAARKQRDAVEKLKAAEKLEASP